jgi:hypothetical protein
MFQVEQKNLLATVQHRQACEDPLRRRTSPQGINVAVHECSSFLWGKSNDGILFCELDLNLPRQQNYENDSSFVQSFLKLEIKVLSSSAKV